MVVGDERIAGLLDWWVAAGVPIHPFIQKSNDPFFVLVVAGGAD